MLALKEYGSSGDECSESETESENAKRQVNDVNDVKDDSSDASLSMDKLSTSINLQICSAPEVVPTVIINYKRNFL